MSKVSGGSGVAVRPVSYLDLNQGSRLHHTNLPNRDKLPDRTNVLQNPRDCLTHETQRWVDPVLVFRSRESLLTGGVEGREMMRNSPNAELGEEGERWVERG